MAHTTLTGAEGSVTIGDPTGLTMNVTRWRLKLSRTVEDDSAFDDGTDGDNARRVGGGMARGTGTLEGWARVGTTPSLGTMATPHEVTGGTFKLRTRYVAVGTASDQGYSFAGLVENLAIGVPKNGRVSLSCSFRTTGAVTKITE